MKGDNKQMAGEEGSKEDDKTNYGSKDVDDSEEITEETESSDDDEDGEGASGTTELNGGSESNEKPKVQ